METNLERMLKRLRAGEMTFGAFIAATRDEYRRMAVYLTRRWSTPEWLTVEDVEQELYVSTWKHLPRYDETRGKSLSAFVTWNAMYETKRIMHKARGVTIHGNPDKKKSRYEMPLSSLGEAGDGDAILAVMTAEAPRAEEALIETETARRAATSALPACSSPRERYAILAIREAGGLEGAGKVLYDDFDHRTALRLGNEAAAERFVMKHAGAVARRMSVGV